MVLPSKPLSPPLGEELNMEIKVTDEQFELLICCLSDSKSRTVPLKKSMCWKAPFMKLHDNIVRGLIDDLIVHLLEEGKVSAKGKGDVQIDKQLPSM